MKKNETFDREKFLPLAMQLKASMDACKAWSDNDYDGMDTKAILEKLKTFQKESNRIHKEIKKLEKEQKEAALSSKK